LENVAARRTKKSPLDIVKWRRRNVWR